MVPANGCTPSVSDPAFASASALAVNCAIVADEFILVGSATSLVTNSKTGLSPFSKTAQVKPAPFPPVSKSIGVVCAIPKDITKVNSKKVIFLMILKFN